MAPFCSGAAPLYDSCSQCPRKCSVNRTLGKAGYCGENAELRIATACLHFGEEPPLTVNGGSGTIFFTGCTLRCAFCQNYQISQQGMGASVDKKSFSEICLKLQNLGAENINLVTGSHHIPLIAQGLKQAKEDGLTIPVAWNSSAYESVESLELLHSLVDIWLPDLKTLNPEVSAKLFGARDYPDVATKAISWMIKNSPLKTVVCQADAGHVSGGTEKEKMISGVIIRHLFLPGRFEDTAVTLEWLKQHADGKAYISLMSQYTPVPFKGTDEELSARKNALSSIENRLVNAQEDEDLQDLIEAFDFENLFYQELSDDTSWLPDFTRTQPFSNKLAKPVWHWAKGFVI